MSEMQMDPAEPEVHTVTDTRRFRPRTMAVWAVALLGVLVGAAIVNLPASRAQDRAHACLVAQRDTIVAALDSLSDSADVERYSVRWAALVALSERDDMFFDPIGSDPSFTGDSFCGEVVELVDDARTESVLRD